MMSAVFSKKYVIFLSIFLVAISPLVGYLFYRTNDNTYGKAATLSPPSSRTREELESILERDRRALGNEVAYRELHVTNYSRRHNNWYIVHVEESDEAGAGDWKSSALIGDFYNSPDRMKVIIRPDELLFRENISYGAAVPYDVIEEMNRLRASEWSE